MGLTHPRSEELAYGYPTVGNTTVIAFTGTVAGAAFAARKLYRLYATQDCYVSFGTTNDATTSAAPMAAGQTEYFGTDDTNTTISVIQDSTGGNLHVTEMVAHKKWVL